MLDTIHTIEFSCLAILSIVHTIYAIVTLCKKEFNKPKNIKCRLVISCIISLLFISEILFDIFLEKLFIQFDIFCTVVWVLNSIFCVFSLRSKEDITPAEEDKDEKKE